jgi:hypothetical protein
MRRGRSNIAPFLESRRQDGLVWATRVLVIVGALFVLAIWGWLRNGDSRALASMDPDLRRELFDRGRKEAELLCARPELGDECRSRVEFLARFPECDASCRELVARQRRRPTR